MLSVEDWAEIRRLHVAERMPIRQIARQLGISKNTVKAKLAADAPPRYRRAATGSAVDEVEPRIRRLLSQTPTMPATVIAERIGWSRGMTVLNARVRATKGVSFQPPKGGQYSTAVDSLGQRSDEGGSGYLKTASTTAGGSPRTIVLARTR